MRRILILGAEGQLGRELQPALAPLGEVVSWGREALDLTQTDSIAPAIAQVQPDIIINSAAYTAVDRAETESNLVMAINAAAPQKMAEAAAELGAFFIHVSTDYVFDGTQSQPYVETSLTNPLNVYGRSKLAGEKAIRMTWEQHLIFRTAWVYGAQGKSNFVKTMLRLGAERPEVRVVADQIGTPTWAGQIAQAIAQLVPQLNPAIAGTYHYTNSGVASWYDFAIAIFEEAQQLGWQLQVKRVVPITTADYPTPAQRPAYSVLSCGKITSVLGTSAPHWRQGLRQMLQQLR